MILNLVRMKGKSLRPKFASILTAALISGLLVSIPVAIPAQANTPICQPTSTSAGGDTVLTFQEVGDCEWTVPLGVTAVRVLVVGGGGPKAPVSAIGIGQPVEAVERLSQVIHYP